MLRSPCDGFRQRADEDACILSCEMTEGIIWRTTEREVTRSVAESRGWARMDDEEARLVAYAQSASPDGHFSNDNISGGDALRGDTRSHPEHDG